MVTEVTDLVGVTGTCCGVDMADVVEGREV